LLLLVVLWRRLLQVAMLLRGLLRTSMVVALGFGASRVIVGLRLRLVRGILAVLGRQLSVLIVVLVVGVRRWRLVLK